MRRIGPALAIFAALALPLPALARARLDLDKMLARPGTRALALGFYAPWSKEAAAELVRLRTGVARHAKEGARLVIVSTASPDGGCATPPVEADELVCDERGTIAATWDATSSLPAIHVFTWQGRVLTERQGAAVAVSALDAFFSRAPKVALGHLETRGPAGSEKVAAEALLGALERSGKLVVDKDARPVPPTPGELPACDRGPELLGDETRLDVALDPARKVMVLAAVAIDEDCALARVSSRLDVEDVPGSAAGAIERLYGALRLKVAPRVEKAAGAETTEASPTTAPPDDDEPEQDAPIAVPHTAELLGLLELETPAGYQSIGEAVLRSVEEVYLEPARARPEPMLRRALATLAAVVPELQVERLGRGKFNVRYGSATTTLSARDTVDLTEIAAELDRVVALVAKDPKRRWSRAGLEVVLLDGALATLDARARILTPPELAASGGKLAMRAGGIAADFTMKNGVLRIVSPLPGGPAARAGLLSGDVVLGIDGAPTASMSFDRALERIRGEVGTPIGVTVMREGWKAPARYELVRGLIEPKPLETRRLDGDIGYLAVRSLSDAATAGMSDALARLPVKRRALRGIVLDLRDLPLGSIEAALALADRFLATGDLASYADRRHREPKAAHASERDVLETPIAVLVNHNTTFAAELLAGALAGSDRAILVGERTAGRAAVLERRPVGQGFGLELASAEWLTAGGQRIEGVGLTPDVAITFTRTGRAAPRADAEPAGLELTAATPADERERPIELARRLLAKVGHARRTTMRSHLGAFLEREGAEPRR